MSEHLSIPTVVFALGLAGTAVFAISQTIRKRIEEHFGWGKTVGRIRQTLYRGIRRVDQHFKPTMTASNIVRMARCRHG